MKLPPGVLLEILHQSRHDKRTLCRLAATSTFFREVAQRMLCENITLSHSLENSKKTLKALKRNRCRLGKFVKQLHLHARGIITQEQIDTDIPPDDDDRDYQGKDFAVHLLTFFSALKGSQSRLNIIIDFDRFYFADDEIAEESVMNCFEQTVAHCLGYVKMNDFWRELTLRACYLHKISWLSDDCFGRRYFSDAKGRVLPGFDVDIFDQNLAHVESVTVQCHGCNHEADGGHDDDECSDVCKIILNGTGVKELKLDVYSYEAFTLPTLKDCELETLRLVKTGLSHRFWPILQSLECLQELELTSICLDWDPRPRYPHGEPWMNVFPCITKLPLARLRIYKLHSSFTPAESCNSSSPVLITERAEDIVALKNMVQKVRANGCIVFVGPQGTQRIVQCLDSDIFTCRHESFVEGGMRHQKCPLPPVEQKDNPWDFLFRDDDIFN